MARIALELLRRDNRVVLASKVYFERLIKLWVSKPLLDIVRILQPSKHDFVFDVLRVLILLVEAKNDESEKTIKTLEHMLEGSDPAKEQSIAIGYRDNTGARGDGPSAGEGVVAIILRGATVLRAEFSD